MMQRAYWKLILAGLSLAVINGTTLAQAFESITLDANKSSGRFSGSLGGSTSLPGVVSNSDRNGKKCLGYGDPDPDHLLVLKDAMPSLTLRVNSGGADTTLIVQGSDGSVRCSFATANKQDTVLTDSDWSPGTYKIWVGSAIPNTRGDYTLIIRR